MMNPDKQHKVDERQQHYECILVGTVNNIEHWQVYNNRMADLNLSIYNTLASD